MPAQQQLPLLALRSSQPPSAKSNMSTTSATHHPLALKKNITNISNGTVQLQQQQQQHNNVSLWRSDQIQNRCGVSHDETAHLLHRYGTVESAMLRHRNKDNHRTSDPWERAVSTSSQQHERRTSSQGWPSEQQQRQHRYQQPPQQHVDHRSHNYSYRSDRVTNRVNSSSVNEERYSRDQLAQCSERFQHDVWRIQWACGVSESRAFELRERYWSAEWAIELYREK